MIIRDGKPLMWGVYPDSDDLVYFVSSVTTKQNISINKLILRLLKRYMRERTANKNKAIPC